MIVLLAALALGGCDAGGDQGGGGNGGGDTQDGSVAPVAEGPALEVEVVADGLTIPWDVQPLPGGELLVGERGGRLLVIDPGAGAGGSEEAAAPREVQHPLTDLFASGEGGLMGLAVSPGFDQDRSVLACYASQEGGSPRDVRVARLTLDEDLAVAELDGVVVDGLPITSGRHSGCRLLLTEDVLLVGTGDAADEVNPQSLASLGGKVLAMTPDGDPLPGAPFVAGGDPRILTYGHRNVQGLAVQPATPGADAGERPGSDAGLPGVVWSVEHGPDVDDEVNVLVPGGNYGWDPGEGYDEGVPMTDLDAFPEAVPAVWSSGRPTHATSGATFLVGEQWGAWEGSLMVAELKGSGLTLLQVEGERVTGTHRIPELDGTHGRLRSLTLDGDGTLWVTTSNGDGQDEVLRVVPGQGQARGPCCGLPSATVSSQPAAARTASIRAS